MSENRKVIPDGFKYYITCKDKNGQKYYCYGHAPSYEYPDGTITDSKTFADFK
jgi:hypothetical protein